MTRKLLISFCGIILILFGLHKILGGRYVRLDKAPPLAGTVSQSMFSNAKVPLPKPGKDFELKDVQYFDSNSWVAATISPVSKNIQSGLVVLQKQDGQYRVKLGPGTAFDSSYLFVLPVGVGQYLRSHGGVYESSQ